MNPMISKEESTELEQLIHSVKLWIQHSCAACGDRLAVEKIADEQFFLRYILETGRYLAEIIVEPAGFHPHRHVAFTALDKEKEPSQPYAYCYYDGENSSPEEIFQNFDDGLRTICGIIHESGTIVG